jgi:galactoside O-acetyltransferase
LLRNTGSSIRHGWWQWRLASLGSNPDIQQDAHFEYAGRVSIGSHCRIARKALVRANTNNQRGISIGNHVSVQENVLINANRGHVVIGDHSWLGPGTVVYGNGGVEIGRDVMVASHCAINTVSHHFDRTDIPMNRQGTYCDPIVLEDDVWIGTAAVILQGVRIGRGSIIGAGAVVTRDIPPYSIAVGVPARVTGSRLKEGNCEIPLSELGNVISLEGK